MATEVARPNVFSRVGAFFHSLPEGYENVRAELRKVTWPDRGQIRQATIGIIAVVLFVGAVIALLDVSLQFLLVRVPTMLTGR
ncbi:MAG: preprotein translocase subunit SecE [Gemmatimonadaceae bacterium]